MQEFDVKHLVTPSVSRSVFVVMAACLAMASGAAAAPDPPKALEGVPWPQATVQAPVAPSSEAPAGAAVSTDPDASPQAASAPAEADDPDLSPTVMVPDFYLINQPTNLRLPKYKMAFRVTHRFTRPLNQDGAVGDFFGLDSGAQIGLELRFAPIRGAQAVFYRTSDKTIDLFGSYNLFSSSGSVPISLSAIGGVEGTNNFKDSYSPSIGAVLSATFGTRLALTVVPTWVNNSNPLPSELVDHNNTFYVGIGGRFRLGKSSYFTAEVTPRVSGYKGGIADLQNTSKYQEGNQLISFAIEKQVGGHVFQLNFSDGVASTPANIARGAATGKTYWYLGFNISRKFY
jgi:hypothetical protein